MTRLTNDSKQELVRLATTLDKQRPLQLRIIKKALTARGQVQIGFIEH